jgi:hypothetical protein
MRMKVLVAALGSALLVVGAVSVAGASLAPGTKLTATSSKVVFVTSINGVAITVSCTQGSPSFTDDGTVEKGDETSMPVEDPSITGCFDSLGGHDIITTSGKWKLTVNGAGGTKLAFVIPKDGLTLTSAVLPSCKVIAAPKGPVDLTGTYSSSKGTDTVKNGKIAVTGSGCTVKSPMLATSTVKFSPNPRRIPPFAS